MSQYIHFYIRSGENFLPIGTFSRSNRIYQICDEVIDPPYEKIQALNITLIERVLADAVNTSNACKEEIAKLEKSKSLVDSFNNSASEKLEVINKLNEVILDYKESLEENQAAEGYIRGLLYILNDIKYDSEYDENDYIYCGIECYRPTVEDIV